MAQILTKNPEKTEKKNIENEIDRIITLLQLPQFFSKRILELYNTAKTMSDFKRTNKTSLLAVCFRRLILENNLYISSRSIKLLFDVHSTGYLSKHFKLYNRFCKILDLEPIHYSLNDHVSNICEIVGLNEDTRKRAVNLITILKKKFLLSGENRTCAITAVYFAFNFQNEPPSISQLDIFNDLISLSILYEKVRLFTRYMKKYLTKKALKGELTKREKYFLTSFDIKHKSDFFRRLKSVKN